jgi:hypothetical protein
VKHLNQHQVRDGLPLQSSDYTAAPHTPIMERATPPLTGLYISRNTLFQGRDYPT